MSIGIPDPLNINVGDIGEFDVGLDLSGDLDVGLDDIGLGVSGSLDVTLPTDYSISIEKLPPIELKPIDFSLRVKEIPSVRAHLPLNYKVGFTFLGRELACINLCGQGQVITEPYEPYPCEPQTVPNPKPVPIPRNDSKLSSRTG